MSSSNGDASWEWQGDLYHHQKDANVDISHCVWNGVNQNEEQLSCVFEDSTPIKACGDLPYPNESGSMNKVYEECRGTSSQVKRRRLQFNNELVDQPFPMEDIPSPFLKSKERIEHVDQPFPVDDPFPEVSPWDAVFEDDISTSALEGLDQTESWLAECLNDTDMLVSSDDANSSGMSDVQIDVSGYCNIQADSGAKIVGKRAVQSSGNVIFKGRKSYMRMPTKLASSVAYPFAFVKPCGANGDVTLNDINQKLRTPPSSDSNQSNEASAYPPSAITGKPVVGKTKIRTDGGKGSITIMRTKG